MLSKDSARFCVPKRLCQEDGKAPVQRNSSPGQDAGSLGFSSTWPFELGRRGVKRAHGGVRAEREQREDVPCNYGRALSSQGPKSSGKPQLLQQQPLSSSHQNHKSPSSPSPTRALPNTHTLPRMETFTHFPCHTWTHTHIHIHTQAQAAQLQLRLLKFSSVSAKLDKTF